MFLLILDHSVIIEENNNNPQFAAKMEEGIHPKSHSSSPNVHDTDVNSLPPVGILARETDNLSTRHFSSPHEVHYSQFSEHWGKVTSQGLSKTAGLVSW